MSRRKIAEALIDEQGEMFSVQVGANIARDVPQQFGRDGLIAVAEQDQAR